MLENVKELWPCLGENGLQVFATTADQRYLLGEDLFLQTHFPIALRRFPINRPVETLDEVILLRRLMNVAGLQPGNRVFILYGAAGSGKSELMRWLQAMIARQDPIRADTTVRIPRTELDVLSITERFHTMLSGAYFSEVTHRRWNEARSKPRTLAKLLLLEALERSLNSDEHINALYYRLLAWIEPRVAHSLAALEMDQTPVTLLTREDLEALKAESVLSIPLDYEQFCHHLLLAFREHLLEGINLPQTLGHISADLSLKGQRPLLLIDDLVQSINLFATDLLDYFITLESGNWDVVIGLTPDALSTHARGRELLDRITYLDTVDDRVEKLWLSDIQGHDSYFLTEETCSAFAACYLKSYRVCNGWECLNCPHRARCTGLNDDGVNEVLSPFNSALLHRIFRALPEGKGKARQFIRVLREVLSAICDGRGLLPTLAQYTRLDTAVESDEFTLARLAELYGPTTLQTGRITLSASLMVALGFPPKAVQMLAEPLQMRSTLPTMAHLSETVDDPARNAIKAWLDGKPTNRQSLLSLRRGIARWLRETGVIQGFHAPGIAHPHDVLQWHRVYLGVCPPILLEGVDEGEGIWVTRGIGLLAFQLHEYAAATGLEKQQIAFVLAQEARLLPLHFAASAYHKGALTRLEVQLGMPLAQLALILYTWLMVTRGLPSPRVPGFEPPFWDEVQLLRTHFPVWLTQVDEVLNKAIVDLFEDCFKLRRNVYNGLVIQHLLNRSTPNKLLEALCQIELSGLDTDYRLKNEPLRDVLSKIQETVSHWIQPVTESALSPTAKVVLETLTSENSQGIQLNQVPGEVWTELETTTPDMYAKLRVLMFTERN